MKNILKNLVKLKFGIICLLVVMISYNVQANDNITIAHYYKPGGGADRGTNAIINGLKDVNYKNITVKYFKSCDQALRYVSTTLNSYMVGGNENYDFSDTSRCRFNQYKDVKPVSSIYKTNLYICSAPHKNLGLEELLSRKNNYSIGTVSGDGALWLSQWNSNNNLNLKIIKYNGSKSTATAILAGDIDFVFAGSVVKMLVEKGAKCFLSSTKNNKFNVPFMGANSLNLKATSEYGFEAILFSQNRNKDFENALIDAADTNSFRNFITENGFTFNGISKNQTQNQFNRYLEDYVEEITNLRKTD